MKQTLAVMCAVIALFASAGCGNEDPAQARAAEEAQRAQTIQSEANEVLHSIRYMKDPRTGLCFAYRWGARVFDGPSLTLAPVPCESISPELLTVAK